MITRRGITTPAFALAAIPASDAPAMNPDQFTAYVRSEMGQMNRPVTDMGLEKE